jgi:phage baseplate assembly protein W
MSGIGMNRDTGKPIDGLAKIEQDIITVLTTPLGSLTMARDYGSLLFRLLDGPMNAATRLLVAAASAAAINRWVKAVKLTRAVMNLGGADGRNTIDLTGYRTDLPASPPFTLSIPV